MIHYCVISHTHWDREWYQTQEEFRMRLIDLFDHLLTILDENPNYIFHMDAQTVVFEDYWEVRPEMKEKCCRYIKEGRILAGPWYVQNDFFITSGEATVRNLLIGMKQADEMGRCARTGYTPDQFGLISQLPQILCGFGLDHCIMGRGYASVKELGAATDVIDSKPTEFIWKSPDGSEVLGIHMAHWYNNAQRFSQNIDNAYRLVNNIKESFEGLATTPYLLLMNGVDHLEAQPDLLPILEEIQKRLPEGESIYQTTMEHYVELVRGAKRKEDMPEEVGELMQGRNTELLKDTASSRGYLKRQNSELQNLFENRLEPLYAWMDFAGMKGIYPSGHMDYLWKMLIRNHAHDSICGCSTDAVHRHMEDRFENFLEMGKELQRRGMKQLAAHVQAGFEQKDYKLVVFNALEKARTELVEVDIDIVAEDNPVGIRIINVEGQEVPFELLDKKMFGKSVFSAINLPGVVDTVRYRIRFVAEDVPAFGYLVYRIVTDAETVRDNKEDKLAFIMNDEYVLENQNLKLTVSKEGKVNLLDKSSGKLFRNILSVQDVADIGNAYVYEPMPSDKPINVTERIAGITLEESDAFYGCVCLHYDVVLPKAYDTVKKCRSEEMVIMPLEIRLSLTRTSKAADIRFVLDNKAEDHRMSAWIHTGIQKDISVATSPYDMIYRNKWDIDTQICNETEHTSGMTAILEKDYGMAVLNRGVYAYENLQDEEGVLTFPIVRATGAISAGVESDDDAWKIPENQCLRVAEIELSLMPLSENNMAQRAAFAAKAFQNPLMAQCEPVDTHKFMGGRAAVQDTEIAEFFYQDLEYADVQLPQRECGFQLMGDGLQVTAFKKSFDRTGYILRFFNGTEEAVEAELHFDGLKAQKVWKTNLRESVREELILQNQTVSIPVKGKEIVTLYLEG